MAKAPRKTICYVTGSRADFGLMKPVLDAIADHPSLRLRLAVTGMHLHRRSGYTLGQIRRDGWRVDQIVPWRQADSPVEVAVATGSATAGLARAFEALAADVVLVLGDRVEAAAASLAGQVSQRIVAHVHGGDRAAGQVDDTLRHAITKLAHLHFPATRQSTERLIRMGEDRWRVFRVGSPAVDGIADLAAPWTDVAGEFGGIERRRYALVVLHPTDPRAKVERRRAEMVVGAIERARIPRAVVVYPNSDPGSAGIARHWDVLAGDTRLTFRRDVPRPLYLALLRDAAVLVGNSSSGIIEAGSFRTPVIDIGDRQAGRERGLHVTHVAFTEPAIAAAVRTAWNRGSPARAPGPGIYGRAGAGARIADILGRLRIDQRLLRKSIAY